MTAIDLSATASVTIVAVITLIIAPLIFVMIFKSERKQARFAYQYSKAQGDIVNIHQFDKANPDNNFKLISGIGEINCDEPIIDELFGLRIQNALKIKRTVEVIQYEPKEKEPTL